jgi:hypothetical protein
MVGFGSRQDRAKESDVASIFWELDNFVYPFSSFTHRQSND